MRLSDIFTRFKKNRPHEQEAAAGEGYLGAL